MKPAEYNAMIANAMPEAALSERVRVACRQLGLLAYHTHTARFSAKGYPDWHILGPTGSLYRELKTEKGRLSVEQVLWLEGLHRAGYDADVWRPRDLLSGRIISELQQLASGSPDGPGGSRSGVARDVRAEHHGRSALFDSRERPTSTASANQAAPGAGTPVRQNVVDALCRGNHPKNATKAERVEAVRRLAADGCSDVIIGRRIDRTPGTVCATRKQHDIPAGRTIANAAWRGKVRTLLAEGLTDPEIAARLSISVSTVAYQRYCIRAEDLRSDDSRQVAS